MTQREEFESALGKGKTYTERDFEMFKLGYCSANRNNTDANSKEQFEKAWSERKFVFGQTVSIKDMAEEFWNKSREQISVEFPPELEPDLDGDTLKPSYQNAYIKGYNEALRDVEIKIQQAGITIE